MMMVRMTCSGVYESCNANMNIIITCNAICAMKMIIKCNIIFVMSVCKILIKFICMCNDSFCNDCV